MDEDDPAEQIQVDEEINAVDDQGNIADENQEEADDDELEELYGDVNVGENFQKYLHMKAAEEKQEADEYEKLYGDVNVGEDFHKYINENVETETDTEMKVEASGGTVSGGENVSAVESREVNKGKGIYEKSVGTGKGGGGCGGCTKVFIRNLEWWTTDAEIEAEVCKYGVVKEVKCFQVKRSGKFLGHCLVTFDDPYAGVACKKGMNGHVFNGRPCVVEYGYKSNDGGRRRGEGGGDPHGGRGVLGDGRNTFGQGMMGHDYHQYMNMHMYPQGMMAPGYNPAFDMPMVPGYNPAFNMPMAAPFPGFMEPVLPLGAIGLPNVEPHGNPSLAGWGAENNPRRYGEEAASGRYGGSNEQDLPGSQHREEKALRRDHQHFRSRDARY